MSEPRLEDDVAYYGAEMCPDCEYRHNADEECVTNDEPDRMWGDEDQYERRTTTTKPSRDSNLAR